MMNCRQCIEFLMDYLNGALSPAERATFDEHLTWCPPCVEYLRQYEETVKLGKECYSCGGPALPGEVPEELIRAILAARPAPPKES
jgi:anti-sigma factor RsiW